jgi:hypothetical protein
MEASEYAVLSLDADDFAMGGIIADDPARSRAPWQMARKPRHVSGERGASAKVPRHLGSDARTIQRGGEWVRDTHRLHPVERPFIVNQS